jgi:uncharacterized phiE125 gp8 family phage protein
MAAPDLTSTADVKAWLGITTSADDTVLAALVTAVSMWVQNTIGRQIASQTYTEVRHGRNKGALMLNNYPVTSITSIAMNGSAIAARSTFGAAGYYLADDTIYLDGGLTFDRGIGNISITYVAGYATIPADIAQATKQLVALRYREKDRIGQVSKSILGETVSFDMKDLPNDVRLVLNNYQRRVMAA